MLRDSKGRFCKAENVSKNKSKKKTKLPFLGCNHIRENKEPMLFKIKIVSNKKNRFDRDDCVNNASIFSKLDLDEQANFIGSILAEFADTCPLNDGTGYSYCYDKKCKDCFNDWFFNMYDSEVFHKILGD